MSVSNDQSPPARKVIPYKKGGRRPSPFAKMAFQFSGTALDVAIQQREQEVVEELSAETPVDEAPLEGSLQATSPTLKDESLQELSPVVIEPTSAAPDVDRELTLPDSAADPKLESVEKRRPPKSVSLLTRRKSKTPIPATAAPDLQGFIMRWKPFLTDTQIGVCTYVYNNSIAINREYCFTSTAKLMEAVSKTERQVKTILSQLIDWELLIKGETIVNAPREKRGTFYKLNLDES